MTKFSLLKLKAQGRNGSGPMTAERSEAACQGQPEGGDRRGAAKKQRSHWKFSFSSFPRRGNAAWSKEESPFDIGKVM